MAGRENEGSSRAHYTFMQHIFPGECSYKSETGGRLKELRELTNDEATNFEFCSTGCVPCWARWAHSMDQVCVRIAYSFFHWL